MTREREYFFGEDRRGPPRGGGMGGMGMPPPRGGGGSSFMHKSAIVKQLKETMQAGHRTGLPPMLLDYFTPRPPLEPGVELKKKKKPVPFTGVAAYVDKFVGPQDPEEVKDAPSKPRLFANPELALQCRLTKETKIEKALRLREWRKEEEVARQAEGLKAWDPRKDPKIEGDPFRTLFVARLNYDVTEKKLRKEFEEYGPIKGLNLVTNPKGKSRGYAFIEYQDKKDMKEAYKTADGRKIEGRRVLVDVERGRTVESWRPRRLGGGMGNESMAPKAPKPKNLKRSWVKLHVLKLETQRPPAAAPVRERSPAQTERDRVDRERERERAERDRVDRERDDRDRSVRREGDGRKRPREPSPRRDRERVYDRERVPERVPERERPPVVERDRGYDRDRERERGHDRDRGRDVEEGHKRRRELEDGEVPVDTRPRERERGRDRDRSPRRREH